MVQKAHFWLQKAVPLLLSLPLSLTNKTYYLFLISYKHELYLSPNDDLTHIFNLWIITDILAWLLFGLNYLWDPDHIWKWKEILRKIKFKHN